MRLRIETWAVLIVAIYSLGVVASFVIRFSSAAVSGDTAHWGQLGDYVGGLLNPIVAGAALVLLAESVRIQRVELAETKDALLRQAESTAIATEIAGLTAVIQAGLMEVEMHRAALRHFSDQLSKQSKVAADVYTQVSLHLLAPDQFDEVLPLYDDRGNRTSRHRAQATVAGIQDAVTEALIRVHFHQEKLSRLMAKDESSATRSDARVAVEEGTDPGA